VRGIAGRGVRRSLETSGSVSAGAGHTRGSGGELMAGHDFLPLSSDLLSQNQAHAQRSQDRPRPRPSRF
jgi:hypothetical protein